LVIGHCTVRSQKTAWKHCSTNICTCTVVAVREMTRCVGFTMYYYSRIRSIVLHYYTTVQTTGNIKSVGRNSEQYGT
jgi:hypothetical protein